MSYIDHLPPEVSAKAEMLRDDRAPFAFVTIIRTAGSTAAKPGAKALVDAEGTILAGFLGGGCTRGAVKRATLAALQSGEPQLVSVTPEDDLADKGVTAGEKVDGVTFSRNGCPSKGTVDLFIEPCLPMPDLVILGASPVAAALTQLAPQFQWNVSADLTGPQSGGKRAIIIATQGQGDLDALEGALAKGADHIAFVGSTKKFASLAAKLTAKGTPTSDIDRIKAPAGINIGAVTAEEIALSILAELISVRRTKLAGAASDG